MPRRIKQMASISPKKATTIGMASGLLQHNFRTRQEHTNPDIDKEKSIQNMNFGASNYQEAKRKLLNRIKELDELHPPIRLKTDRKTSMDLYIPAPREGMTRENEQEFFKATYEAFKSLYGGNVICGSVHFDEIHEYIGTDKQTHMSRGHMHLVLIPWTDDKGLNMNAFLTRSRFHEFNKICEDVCMTHFNDHWNDGSKKQGKLSMLELKIQSAEAQAQKSEESLAKAKAEIKGMLADIDTLHAYQSSLNASINALNEKIDDLTTQYDERGGESATQALIQAQKKLQEVRELEIKTDKVLATIQEKKNNSWLQYGVDDIEEMKVRDFRALLESLDKDEYPNISDTIRALDQAIEQIEEYIRE